MANLFLSALFLYCWALVPLMAQQPYAIHLKGEKDIPSHTVYSLLQDSKGFVWMGTNEGLSRYDGFENVIYRSALQTSIPGSSIKEDRLGRVWYENFDGFLYYILHDSLHSLSQNKPIGYLPFGITNEYLFVAQKKGIDVYDIQTLERTKSFHLPIEDVESSHVKDSDFYFISDDILYRIDKNLELTHSRFFHDKKLKMKYIYSYYNRIYVLSKYNETQTLYFFTPDLKPDSEVRIPGPVFIQGSDVIGGKIWIYTSKGVHVCDRDGKLEDRVFFPSNSISCVIKDRQDNYWFATTDNGVYLVPQLQDEAYSYGSLLRITENKNGFLVTTKTGELIQTDRSLQQKQVLATNSKNMPAYYVYHDSVYNHTLYSSAEFVVMSDRSRHYNIAVKDVVRLDDAFYAFASSGYCGLLLNPSVGKEISSPWKTVFEENIDPDFPNMAKLKKGVRAKSLDYEPLSRTIVVATNIGLFLITPDGQREVRFNHQPVYANKVVYFQNNVYMHDTKGSLYKISPGINFQLLNSKMGIDDYDVRSIKKQGDELLVVSRRYIFIYNLITGTVQRADVNTGGIQINDVLKKGNDLIVLTDENILQVAINGKSQKQGATFIVNYVMANQTKQDWTEAFDLKHSQNNITVNYSLIDFGNNIWPDIYYNLNGNGWVPLSKETRTIQFASLAPGAYSLTFRLGEKVLEQNLRFNIHTPFWKAWWFYALCFVAGVTLLYFYFRWRTRLMVNQIRLLNEKVMLKESLNMSILTSIKSQMNPHFFYNALNTIQAYIFTNDKKSANTYLAKFSKLTRNILEMSEREVISLQEEIESLTLYLELEKMRFSDNFHFTIDAQDISNKDEIEFPPMLIQPYVENAVKHGLLHKETDKRLDVIFSVSGDMITVTVDDNGIGRKRSRELNMIKGEKHRSFSTEANEKRLEILNRGSHNKIGVRIIDKFDAHGLAAGTTVIITIPIN